jgi:transposase
MQGREKVQKALFGTMPLEELLPADHPLRKIRADFDAAYARLASAFETNYGSTGNVSVPTPVLLRAWLLMALYSIRSERALCEQITMNGGFRWFVGLDWDDKVFDHSTLSRNRERLFGSGAAEALFAEVVRIAESRRLLVSDRLVVDGTQIKAWASMKSFKAKDGSDDDKPNFKGTKRSNSTHVSKTDPDAKLLRKGPGQESMLCHIGHALVDSVTGLVRAFRITQACGLGGNVEVLAALEMAEAHMEPGQTLVADRGYDETNFVQGLRERGIKAHPRAKKKQSALDGRTTKRPGYEASMKRRYIPEPVFGWVKNRGRMRQTMLKGTLKVSWQFHLYCMAYNLRRLAGPVQEYEKQPQMGRSGHSSCREPGPMRPCFLCFEKLCPLSARQPDSAYVLS